MGCTVPPPFAGGLAPEDHLTKRVRARVIPRGVHGLLRLWRSGGRGAYPTDTVKRIFRAGAAIAIGAALATATAGACGGRSGLLDDATDAAAVGASDGAPDARAVHDARPADVTLHDAGPDGKDGSSDASHDGSDGGARDSGHHDAGSPVNSLLLEQVWFMTGERDGGLKNYFVDFRKPGTPIVTCNAQVPPATGDEGTAVFTDPNTGQLLLYTDGITVYNGADGTQLANGNGLMGQPSATEPGLITPTSTGIGKTFYVFTLDYSDDSSPTGDIYYSIADLGQGPHGTVVNKNTHLFSGNVGEALDVLPHANGADFWVLTYAGASTVDAFLVGASGVSTTPVSSSTGLAGTVLRSAINHSYDYGHVVLAMSFGGTPAGQLATADFDRSTGLLSNVKSVATGDLGYHASYSGDGTKLYYVKGTEGWQGVAYQYDLTTGTETMLGGSGLAAGKLALDGKLYFVGYSKPALSVVSSPDAPGAAAGFVADALPLGGCLGAFGVPNQTAAHW